MSDTDNRLTEFLREHPRMIGVLFTIVMLISQSGAVAAAGQTTPGP